MKWLLRIVMFVIDSIMMWALATVVMSALQLMHLPEVFQLVMGMASIVCGIMYMNYRSHWRSTINQ